MKSEEMRLHELAAKCRRLAAQVDLATEQSLIALASEYEHRARVLEEQAVAMPGPRITI